jgi:two-component sensor histidine kinase
LFFLNDSLSSSFLLNSSPLLGLGLLSFMVIQESVLTRRFSRAFDRGEALQDELFRANEKLEEENGLYRETQSRLESALSEKELLLREVHHRVKNSLQIVSSTLALQAHRSKDSASLAAYDSIRDRLRAISLVHEKLYALDSGDLVDLGAYTGDLVAEIASGYDPKGERVRLFVEADPVEVHMQVCVDFGLVLAELLTNAFKYAVLPRDGGRVAVFLKTEGQGLVLRVEDDGPGFPNGFDPETSSNLGLQIARGIVKKYKGGLALLPGAGGRIEARFSSALKETPSLSSAKKRIVKNGE